MYYPPLFATVRPFDPRASSLEGPPVGRENNPLDLSNKTIRPSSDAAAAAGGADADDLLMLEHRKLASLAASHSLSAMGRQLLDPSLYRLGYGAEAAALIPGLTPPFCFDRTTGVAVPTSLAGHQLMSSFLQQRERLVVEQQQAFYAARNSAVAQQQAAVAAAAAAYMDPASLPLHLRNGLTQREAAAALAATRGLYAPALPAPMVLPAFSLFTEDKGAFTSVRPPTSTTSAEKGFINGVTSTPALEAARYAEQLQRLREQHLQQHQTTGKCSNACCTTGTLPLGQASVPCACCPSQAALCARSPLGCATKDPTSAATGKMGDFPQPGLTFLHRPTATTTAASTSSATSTSELKLSVSSLCSSQTSTEPTTVNSRDKSHSSLRPPTIWNAGLPSVSTGGKTAFSVPKKKENKETSQYSKEHRSSGSIKDILKDNQNNNSNVHHVSKTETHKVCPQPVKHEIPKKNIDKNSMFLNEDYSHRYYHRDTSDITFNFHKNSSTIHSKSSSCNPVVNGNDTLTTVTSVTPIVPTRCEGGSIPVTKMPPLLEAVKPPDFQTPIERSSDIPSSMSSPHGPPPLIAVSNVNEMPMTSIKTPSYISPEISSPLRIPSSIYPNSTMAMPSFKIQTDKPITDSSNCKISSKSPKKAQSTPKYNGVSMGFSNADHPIVFPKPIPSKPIPHLPTPHISANATQFSSHYRPAQHQLSLQTHNEWIPHANPNVTVAPQPQPVTSSAVTATSTAPVTSASRVSKSKQITCPPPPVTIKREPEYADTGNVLQSLLIRSTSESLTTLPPSSLQEPAANIISPSTNLPLFGIDYRYPHLARQMTLPIENLVKSSVEASTVPIATTTHGSLKSDLIKTEQPTYSSSKHKKRPMLSNEEVGPAKKRILSPEFNVPMPRYSFQPVAFASEAAEAPECPYTFIPDPPLNFSGQIKTEESLKSHWRGMMTKPTMTVPTPCDIPQSPLIVPSKLPSTPLEHPWANKSTCLLSSQSVQQEAAAEHTVPPEQQSDSERLSALRARRKLRTKLLSRIYRQRRPLTTGSVAPSRESIEKQLAVRYARKLLSQLTLRWAHRRYMHKWYAIKRPSIAAVLKLRRKKKNGKVIYKIRRTEDKMKLTKEEKCSTKIKESSCSMPIPSEMKRLMVNKALGETPLHRAARLGYPEAVAYCLRTKCVSVNARDNAGYTPLHECCSRGHLDIARALLQYGADVNASAAGGIRPLHDAVENDQVEIVRLLLSYGADPTIATYSGLEPMKLARSAMMAEFLQGFFADISGEIDTRPHLPWRFWGSARCLDPDDGGYDIFSGVPSDSECDGEGENDFLFEVSDSPHLPTFRLLFSTANNKAQCNYLRLKDVLRKLCMAKDEFQHLYGHIEILSLPRHEFEASATCSPLLTGNKLDTSSRPTPMDRMSGTMTDLVRLDNSIRKVLGIETISVR